MKRLSIIPLAVLAVTPLTRVTAQEPPPVKVGDRVRVTHSCVARARAAGLRCRTDAGTVAALSADSLVLDDQGTYLPVPIIAMTKLEASRGQKSRVGRGAGIGFLVGAGLGAGVGFAFGKGLEDAHLCDCHTVMMAVGGLGVGALGALLGAAAGAGSKTERWEEVPLDR